MICILGFSRCYIYALVVFKGEYANYSYTDLSLLCLAAASEMCIAFASRKISVKSTKIAFDDIDLKIAPQA